MIRSIEALNLFTQNAKKLAGFYKEKVGLKVKFQAEMGKKGEEVYELDVGKKSSLYIIDHSDINGKSREPKRIVFNLEVDDIKKEVTRIKKAKVKLIQDT